MKDKALFLYNIDPYHLLRINRKLKINEYLMKNSIFFSGILDGLQKNNFEAEIYHKPNVFFGYFTFKNHILRSLINYLIAPLNRYLTTNKLIKIIESNQIKIVIANPLTFCGSSFFNYLNENNIPSAQWFGIFPNSIKFNNKIMLRNTPKFSITCFSGDIDNKFPFRYKPKKFIKIHNPNIIEPLNKISKSTEILFIGGLQKKHSNRWDILENIFNNFGDKLEVHGYGLDEVPLKYKFRAIVKGPIFGDEYKRKVASSVIVINLLLDGYENFTGINNRIFEVLMLKSFLITPFNKGIEDFFQIGRDLVTFKNNNELIDLIKFYTKNKEERKIIQNNFFKKSKKYNSDFHKTII